MTIGDGIAILGIACAIAAYNGIGRLADAAKEIAEMIWPPKDDVSGGERDV